MPCLTLFHPDCAWLTPPLSLDIFYCGCHGGVLSTDSKSFELYCGTCCQGGSAALWVLRSKMSGERNSREPLDVRIHVNFAIRFLAAGLVRQTAWKALWLLGYCTPGSREGGKPDYSLLSLSLSKRGPASSMTRGTEFQIKHEGDLYNRRKNQRMLKLLSRRENILSIVLGAEMHVTSYLYVCKWGSVWTI